MSIINFEGKVAIVTGAGGGLGRSHALALAERGARVVVNDFGGAVNGAGGSISAAESVAAEIRGLGGEAIADCASVTDTEGVQAMVDTTMAAFGRIDILIANAGILRDKSFGKMTLEDFEAVLAVHVLGTVKPIKSVWPIMQAQKSGRILVTTSSSGLFGNFGQVNYATAKLGLVGMMNALCIEGAKSDIRINALAPAATTRMTAGLLPEAAHEMLKPELVTPGVLYLVSEDAPNGVILGAGAGSFATTRLVETAGTHLGSNVTPEMVRDHWAQISDPSAAEPVANAGEQTGKFIMLALNAD